MSSRVRKRAALEAFKAKRRGEQVYDKAGSDSDVDLYDEVSDSEFRSIVRGRMMTDNFIEDDDDGGYVDTGAPEWSGGEKSEEETEDRLAAFGTKSAKGKKRTFAEQNDYIASTTKPKPQRPAPSLTATAGTRKLFGGAKKNTMQQDEAFMSSIFDDLEAEPAPTAPRVRTMVPAAVTPVHVALRNAPKQALTVPEPYKREYRETSAIPSSSSPHTDPAQLRKRRVSPSSPVRSEERASSDSIKTPPDNHKHHLEPHVQLADSQEMLWETPSKKMRVDEQAAPPPLLPAPKLRKEAPKAETIDWRDIHASLMQADKMDDIDADLDEDDGDDKDLLDLDAGEVDKKTALKKEFCHDGEAEAHFYWLDFFEQGDKVYLIGKIKSKETGKYVSCCVTVEGIERCLFVLPKQPPEEQNLEHSRRVRDSKDSDVEDVEEAWQDEVFEEFEQIRERNGISATMSKWVLRNYAFELPDVPRESKYLKVRYGFDEPAIPHDTTGKTIARIFGTNTSAFELLVLKRRIMGPCWLRLTDVTIQEKGKASWCKVEMTVGEPKSVSVFADSDTTAPRDIPTLTVMSLSMRTVVNVKENKKEILCASARTWQNYTIDADEKAPSSLQTFVRALGGRFPEGFESLARKAPTKLAACKFERGLINGLLAHIQNMDPDIILGHDLVGVSLDVLLHRMKDLKAEHWSRVGRLKRTRWPTLSAYWNVPLLSGRLILDLSSDCGKSMITSTTWSLTEMAATHLGIQRDDIDGDETAGIFLNDAKQIMLFLAHNDMDSWLQMAIASKVQILPLTKQLTNIAGNSWNRTLNGGRAERNEYILLHDFHAKKFICPDKLGRKKAAAEKTDKKDKFKGGLVFEPKRGLCDKFVLVMDFNSLYPSIIQEYNIDFTTVQRSITDIPADGDADAIPDVPSSDVDRGVLPTLISKLVDKRREVKGLMKDKRAPAASLAQWNVKQLALKLTANSMYGCLGFEGSRFYARPLAALTTFKGRAILTETRELAESMSLDVIYGDTDSVMINTNVTTYADAIKIGNEFKRLVKKRYKLLEIDIDAVFQRMLLLQKKKYAALKVEDDGKTSKEIKGLDMKRREFCMLSKDASVFVLDQILSGDPTETVIEQIHEYLRELGEDTRNSKLPLESFVIHKRLGKNPEDYPDAKGQPHVQVALRMKKKGVSARSGDVIPYVFCRPEGEAASTRSAQADRAYHPDDLRRADSKLTIDYKYYLSLQVLPPVERLCESIEGTDKSRLAECLGLDTSRYAAITASEAVDEGGAFATLESQVAAEERYKECAPLEFHCRACGHRTRFEGLWNGRSILAGDHLRCASQQCRTRINLPSLSIQLQQQISEFISQYYAGWMQCTDSGCGLRTRMTGVFAKKCLAPGCQGSVIQIYSDKMLYTQLSYYQWLFDKDALKKSAEGAKNSSTVANILNEHRRVIAVLGNVVRSYLERNGRKYVDLGILFAGITVN